MSDFFEEKNNQEGEITGFDEINGETKTEDANNYDEINNKIKDNYSEFENGFYTKSKSNIIQDETNDTSNEYNTYDSRFHTDDTGNNQYYQSPIINTEKKPKKEKKRYGFGLVAVCCILSAVIGGLSGFYALRFSNNNVTDFTKENLPQISTGSEKEDSSNDVKINVNENVSSISQAVAKKCANSVVGIRTTTSVISFFGGTSESTGEGSGVVYTKDGYIVTNYHVIENAVTSSTSSKIEVFFDNANTKAYQASVVGYNISCDLAVLKINANNLSGVELGNSSDLTVGQYVVTIGAPGGLEFMGSVTYGIISGLDRVVSSNSKVGLIQTDAAINPGNSGGALLDQNGKLIGINSSKIVSEEFEGMGFAIPINTVVEICNDIISNKDKAEPYVGITISEKYTSDVLNAYGYPSGAVVLSVASGSTAEKCGIQKGDIITRFNGTEITEYNVFGEVLSKCKPNSKVDIEIYRSGRTYSATIAIDSNSSDNQ